MMAMTFDNGNLKVKKALVTKVTYDQAVRLHFAGNSDTNDGKYDCNDNGNDNLKVTFHIISTILPFDIRYWYLIFDCNYDGNGNYNFKSYLPHYLRHPAFSWPSPSRLRGVSSILFGGSGTKPATNISYFIFEYI